MFEIRQRCQEIVADVMKRRARGEIISDSSVIFQYPMLMPELQEHLTHASYDRGSIRLVGESSLMDYPDDPPRGEPASPPAGYRRTVREMSGDLWTTVHEGTGDSRPDDQNSDETNAPRDDRVVRFRPVNRPPTATLLVYYDDQLTFDRVRVATDRLIIGRTEGDVTVPHDDQVSDPHAIIERRFEDGQHRWSLTDAGSAAGTFVRVSEMRLKHGDEVLIGRAHVRFGTGGGEDWLDRLNSDQLDDRIMLTGSEYWTGSDSFCLPWFQDDPLLERKHAHLYRTSKGRWYLKETKTLNGVWARVTSVPLTALCSFQLGQQRFGFMVP